MDVALKQLPPMLVLGALVAIFVSLQRRRPSPRLRLWLFAWGLIFLNYLAAMLYFVPALSELRVFLRLGCLQVAGIVFMVSMTEVAQQAYKRSLIWLNFAFPVALYAVLLAHEEGPGWPYALCAAVFFYGAVFWIAALQPFHFMARLAAMVALGAFGTWAIASGLNQPFHGYMAIEIATYTAAGISFWMLYRKATPSVLTACAGFFSWAAMWLLALLFPAQVLKSFGMEHSLWDVPKYLIAFGMILRLLEDESETVQGARDREHSLNVQLQHFADVTSRLLTGVDAKSFCAHIANVITEATTFQRVAIFLVDENRRMYIAGFSGLTDAVFERLNEITSQLTPEDIAKLCAQGQPAGQTAVICKDTAWFGEVAFDEDEEPNSNWQAGDEMLVPLRSPRGSIVGCISLDSPRDPEYVRLGEMSKIEMLAGDLAVALENAELQRHLVTTEKLAGIGQLISGVAHELNNPLTAVLGYAELLGEQTQDEQTQRGLGVVKREALRMRTIIENLLRFSQQNKPEPKQIDILPLMDEVLTMKAFEARARNVELVRNFPGTLPRVAVDPTQLKQVFLNVLNNALDAVENAPQKIITVSGRQEDGKVVLTFVDSGPGFQNIDRIFDPFFTTKGVGRGTGLGLSICYGILKQHHGNILARNVQPTGACVTLELPIAQVESGVARVQRLSHGTRS